MLSQTRDARFWDRIARKYAADPIADMAGYERTLERTRQLLGASDHVLEIGCGTGTTALRLAGGVGRLLATDLSSQMIAIAREKAAAQGCSNLELAVATADRTPAADASMDAVLAFNVLHLLKDRAATLAHVGRLLRPGGVLICKTPCLAEMNPLIRLAVPALRLIGRAPTVAVFSSGQLARDVEAAGLTVVEQARHGSGRSDARIFIVARKPLAAGDRGAFPAAPA